MYFCSLCPIWVSSKTALILPTEGDGNISQVQSPLLAFRPGVWVRRTWGLVNVPIAALPHAERHGKVGTGLKKFEVMGAQNGVMNSYSGQMVGIGLRPLCLYYVGGLWFGEGAQQGHIGTWQSVDHLCVCNDISSLALKANGTVVSTRNI